MFPPVRNRTRLVVVRALTSTISLVEAGDLIVAERVLIREVVVRKVVGEASTSRLHRSLFRALLLLLLVVTLHPLLRTDRLGVHQPKMNVPTVARKDTTKTLARFWRLSVMRSVVGSQSALFGWLWTPTPQRTIDIFGNWKFDSPPQIRPAVLDLAMFLIGPLGSIFSSSGSNTLVWDKIRCFGSLGVFPVETLGKLKLRFLTLDY